MPQIPYTPKTTGEGWTSPESFPRFIGVIEWPEREPDVILAGTAHEVRLEALTLILTMEPDGTIRFVPGFDGDELAAFAAEHPVPQDLTDLSAVKEWHDALLEVSASPRLSIFGPPSDPGEDVYRWIHATIGSRLRKEGPER